MLLLLMGGTAPAAPRDTLGMCSDYSIVINDEHLPWLTKHMLKQDDSVMIELLADREVHLRGERINDRNLQNAVTTIAMDGDLVETNQALRDGALRLHTRWTLDGRLDALSIATRRTGEPDQWQLILGDLALPEAVLDRQTHPELMDRITFALSRNAALVYRNKNSGEELQLFAGYLNERVEALISLCNAAL